MMSREGPRGSLHLADGTVWEGSSFGAEVTVSGEVVFNTGMVGYPESLTDPSYRGQVLVLTYPLVGNYGVPDESQIDEHGLPTNFESGHIHISALVISSYSEEHSHWNAVRRLGDWLKKAGVPAISGVDTRELTKRIREHGVLLGKLVAGGPDVEIVDPNTRNLVAEVSRTEPCVFLPTPKGDERIEDLPWITCIDCGMKNNIIRLLVSSGVRVRVVPWDYDIFQDHFDGLFISNGPGDPTMCTATIANVKRVVEHPRPKPVFGICLGNQILALATGAKTYKMAYGNRGMNQPCLDLRTGRCYITAQNHGFAVDGTSLQDGWMELFVNANDQSNEGIIHAYKPFFSVQFHPEATAGPTDTEFLFSDFLRLVSGSPRKVYTMAPQIYVGGLAKVLVLGSGALCIGQAGEFDYSGSQAVKALQEQQIQTILINPNIATVQTSQGLADKVYFLPVTPEFVEGVIKKENPDGVLLTFGGQTALNCGIQLDKLGVFEKYNVQVLGTPIRAIEITEDRDLFAKALSSIGEKVAPSFAATTIPDALRAAEDIGYPVIVRAAYALGGLGSGFADNATELEALVERALTTSPQVLVEKSLKGWKEVEYEVVRDWKDNCITVCNMENFDPLGIHTGDSIVVAPSQTLTNREYYLLRSAALRIIRHLGVIGECNIQYALHPLSEEYFVIEVNARLSRSSALASKATGYPLAYVATKLALKKDLYQLRNGVTRVTTACFEPSLDYCVVKVPCWDLQKFTGISQEIGSAMKSVGEVMAIGRTFEEAIQKAVRMAHPRIDGLETTQDLLLDPVVYGDVTQETRDQAMQEKIRAELTAPSDKRVFAVYAALESGWTVDEIHELSRIDRWFLQRLKNIAEATMEVRRVHADMPQAPDTSAMSPRTAQPANVRLNTEDLWHLKRLGFSDRTLARLTKSTPASIRVLRKSVGVTPCVKQIDTLAAEFPAMTNYLYMTYNGTHHDMEPSREGFIVLGCGAYRIGCSVEFDWCAVSCVDTLRREGRKAIVINYNPETVSTDYDKSDRLYFEELSLERVLDIYELEQPAGVVVSVGGQIANDLAMPLGRHDVPVMGTSPADIDQAEDRFKFSAMLDTLKVDQPAWQQLTNPEDAEAFAIRVGLPVLVRPSYVLSGAAMNVAHSLLDLRKCLSEAASVSKEHPVVISKFVEGAKEIEFDAVAAQGEVLNYAISEHVEQAGVHSGDATLVLPAQKLYVETMKRVKRASQKIAKHLHISGPFNIQFMAKANDILVIECNLRASRTLPFVSKVLNIPFVEMATKAMIGRPVEIKPTNIYDLEYVAIKVPMFSFPRLVGADPLLGVEMASTGEAACFGDDMYEAFLKALMSTGFPLPNKTRRILVMTGPPESKIELLESVKTLLALGYELFATHGTADFLTEHGVSNVTRLHKPVGKQQPNVMNYLKAKDFDVVITIPASGDDEELENGKLIRRACIDYGVGLITNVKYAKMYCKALDRAKEFPCRSWDEYLGQSSEAPHVLPLKARVAHLGY